MIICVSPIIFFQSVEVTLKPDKYSNLQRICIGRNFSYLRYVYAFKALTQATLTLSFVLDMVRSLFVRALSIGEAMRERI